MAKTARNGETPPELSSLFLTIGQRIRHLREQRDFSQKELATRSGIRQPYLAEIEIVGVNMSLRLLHSIAEALDVSLRDLLPGGGGKTDLETSLMTVREKIHSASGPLQVFWDEYAELLKLVDNSR